MNRGSEKSIYEPTFSLPGFNEAPIHESGKSRSRFGPFAP